MRYTKWVVVGAAGLIAGTALGAGFQLYTEGSTEALGQAGAISGRDDLISLAWYNPAALAGAERPAIMAGSTFASLRTDFKSDVSPALDSSVDDHWQAIPHLYYVQPINESMTAMLSINAPYGLATDWEDDWAGTAVANFSEIRTVYITPSFAWHPIEKLSVAAGFNLVPADAELTNNSMELEGDTVGYGGSLSAHYAFHEDWSVGARYQSRVKLEIEGEADMLVAVGPLPAGKYDGAADITLPSTFNIGVANSSVKNLKLGLDVVWTEWSTYDELAVTLGTPLGDVDLPPSEKDWGDVFSIRLGAEYALAEAWALRCGYVWDESPANDKTREPILPGSDRQMIMFGVGWQGERIGVDLAYSYLWAENAPMGSDVVAQSGGALAGEFETTTHLIALSAGYTF